MNRNLGLIALFSGLFVSWADAKPLKVFIRFPYEL